ncbi:MAG TPA: hypothetical protein VJ553_04800 [Candidatus Paceibacterota bacterium]|nr:hypothetical protein [Candidatus Paceibacterota bacterium]
MEWSCIGHEQEKAYFAALLDDGRVGHAYLFTGVEGIGKRMVSEDVARAMVGSGPTFDLLRLAPERDEDGKLHDIPIDAVRAMKSWIVLRPMGEHKVVLIDDADRLGDEAANTLLKVLEEPPAYAHFLLVSSRSGAVLPTISSRCERVEFRPVSDAELRTVIDPYTLDADDRALVATIAAGRPGVAVRLVTEKKLVTAATAIASLEKALTGGVTEQFAIAKTVAVSPDAEDIVSWWLGFVHARLATKPNLAPVAKGLLELSEAFTEIGINRRLALERFFLELD